MTDATPIAEHCAKFNAEILSAFNEAIIRFLPPDLIAPNHPVTVLDIFGGVGGIHTLQIRGQRVTYAVELQPGWAAQSALFGPTVCANFLTFRPVIHRWPETFHVVATSCSYGNRMADRHNAREDSKRLTYAHTLRRHGEEIHAANSGGLQWGDEYRDFHRLAWNKVAGLVKYRGLFILNIKDHVRRGKLQGVPAWHRDCVLSLRGTKGQRVFELVHEYRIPVKGMGFGKNQTADEGLKVDYEHVYVFRKVEK